MHIPPDRPSRSAEHQAVEATALLSTLSVAAEWMAAYQARREGRDPSAQQPHTLAQREGQEAGAELSGLAMRLVAALAMGEEEGTAALLRRLDQMLVLRRMGRLLTELQGHVLSLYPAVSEGLAEDVREAIAARAELAAREGDAFDSAAALFAASVLRLVARVRDETA